MALEKVEPLVTEYDVLLGFTTYAGPIRSKFLIELRDNKRITGTRCPACHQVYVPAKPNCIKCQASLDEWVNVSDKGTLVTYAVVRSPDPLYPKEAPFAYGIIKLADADTGIVHFLGETDLEKIKTGMRVQAVFKEERTGSILDIDYFKPI
ncbi:Zn-ribbon domain-containing OB-fold protein [Chloroflexota bacterium]